MHEFRPRRLARRLALLAVVLTAPSLFPNHLVGQPPVAGVDSSVMRGTVVNGATGAPLPYAILSIASIGKEHFANDRGRFFFPTRPGTYVLRVRQLGYLPAVLSVTVSNGKFADVTVRLSRLAQHLAAMTVVGTLPCSSPGRTELAKDLRALEVIEQIEQSADRARLFGEEFPFVVRTAT